MSGSNFLFIVTGSIAAYKACDVISKLAQNGHRVRVVATPSALKFVGPATLGALTGEPVLSDLFEAGRALDHIQLTRWADAVVICPATANTINRLAAGLADDLAGALFLAHDRTKPWVIAPAMNPAMWAHPATVRSVQQLRDWDVQFINPGSGVTACGEIGEGRLAEPSVIVTALERAVARPVKKLRVLITSGGTSEPIDGVRVLTNTSTGATGAALANYFHRCGHDVVLLRAAHSVPAASAIAQETFTSCADLASALARHLGRDAFDAVIHAAAVSDFHVGSISVAGQTIERGGKIDSALPPTLHLAPNPKLVSQLRTFSRNPRIAVVAFKLTHHASPEQTADALARLFAHSAPDIIVHNDLAERPSDTPDAFPATLHFRDPPAPPAPCATRLALAEQLEHVLAQFTFTPTPPCSSASTSETATSMPASSTATA